MTNKNKIHVTTRAAIIDLDQILLCKTTDLASNFYFMPGGHIEHGESAENALLRELVEETGSNGKIKRLLGMMEYSFEPGHSSICHNHEYSFYFEVNLDNLSYGDNLPKLEDNIDLVWVKIEELLNLDFRPEPIARLLPTWLAQTSGSSFHSEMKLIIKESS